MGDKMKTKNLLLLALSLAFSGAYCDDKTSHLIQGVAMNQTIEHQKEKFFIGLELRTNNEECSLAMPAHKDKFFKENIPSKIPNKINGNILALYVGTLPTPFYSTNQDHRTAADVQTVNKITLDF